MKKKRKTDEHRPRRSRRLIHTTAAIRERVGYVCEYLFGGNVPLFANAVGLEAKHLRLCLYYESRFTPSMLAQIISMTNVRAEWLLCGSGPMLSAGSPEGLETLALPRTLDASFPLFDATTVPALPVVRSVAPSSHDPGALTPETIAAARAVLAARGADKPVYVLLGKDAMYAGVRPVVTDLLEKKYVTGVGLTAAAVELEVPAAATLDKSHIAKLGAQAGLGFGEALARWGMPADASISATAQRLNVPMTVHSEFGEVGDHFKASLRGAELGAALGAVSYVDLLIFAEQVQRFGGAPGGVCIVLGEGTRFGNLLVRALNTVRQTNTEPYQDFSVVLVDHAPDANLNHLIGCNGGHFHFIQGDLASGADGLAKACDAVFDGII